MKNNNSLLNRSACKDLALRWATANRTGWLPNRVSKQFLDDLDTKVRLLIQGSVNKHRTVGRTIRDLF